MYCLSWFDTVSATKNGGSPGGGGRGHKLESKVGRNFYWPWRREGGMWDSQDGVNWEKMGKVL